MSAPVPVYTRIPADLLDRVDAYAKTLGRPSDSRGPTRAMAIIELLEKGLALKTGSEPKRGRM